MKKKAKKRDSDRVKRSSSEFSFFSKKRENEEEDRLYVTPRDYRWIDDIWHRMTLDQRIEAVVPFRDARGRGVLTRAVRNKEYGLVELLLGNERVNVNEQDMYGNTPLHHAVLVQDGEMLKILLDSNRIMPAIGNKDGVRVIQMLKELEDSDMFTSSILHYSFWRISQLDSY